MFLRSKPSKSKSDLMSILNGSGIAILVFPFGAVSARNVTFIVFNPSSSPERYNLICYKVSCESLLAIESIIGHILLTIALITIDTSDSYIGFCNNNSSIVISILSN